MLDITLVPDAGSEDETRVVDDSTRFAREPGRVAEGPRVGESDIWGELAADLVAKAPVWRSDSQSRFRARDPSCCRNSFRIQAARSAAAARSFDEPLMKRRRTRSRGRKSAVQLAAGGCPLIVTG
jgi:hypothetical protein